MLHTRVDQIVTLHLNGVREAEAGPVVYSFNVSMHDMVEEKTQGTVCA